ncbi:magnesium transporter CorA family protein [Candidatus Uhrbacteria bacterium]|nr:magnesium transporter CorA family protein [Candidatus Uhrbacteria bacterium]
MVPPAIHTLKIGRLQWINVSDPEETALEYLRKKFRLNASDIADCHPELQRPKVIARPNYLFGIFLFPVFNPSSRIIEQKEVDFFLTKSAIITIHDNQIPDLGAFFEALARRGESARAFSRDGAALIAQILDELIDTSFPLLQKLSLDIDTLRGQVLHNHSNPRFVTDILHLKNNLVAFRKAAQPTEGLLNRIISALPRHHDLSREARIAFDRLIDHTHEINEHLEIYRDAIEAVEDTHSTMISFRLNDIVRVLTVFSVILLSLTFFSNLFIIEAVDTPIIGRPFDWWALLGIMTLSTLAAIGIFKKKKWL